MLPKQIEKGMQNIRLVRDGIFPIIKDENGKILEALPATGFLVPGTIQGEGKLIGIPVLFIRTAGCNLRCMWKLPNGKVSICDTAFSSFDVNNSEQISIDKIVKIIRNNLRNIRHIVISGGEPMLQKEALISLCTELKKQLSIHITIETNGTIFIDELIGLVDLFSISPKLANSNPTKEKLEELNMLSLSNFITSHNKNRINYSAIQNFIDLKKSKDSDVQLKFVVANAKDEQEIHDLLNRLSGWENEDIVLMQAGADIQELRQSEKIIIKMAIENGWRFTPRLHIELFGDKRSV